MKELTEDQFDELFDVVPGPNGDDVRATSQGIDLDSPHLWTIVEGDEGDLYAQNGPAVVNRVAYLVTTQPWTEDTVAEWFVHANHDFDED